MASPMWRQPPGDRKSVVEGKRGDLGGRRLIKKRKEGARYLTVTGVQTCALPIFRLRLRGGLADRRLQRGWPHRCGDSLREIGRASWRERGEISVGAGSLKKEKRERDI